MKWQTRRPVTRFSRLLAKRRGGSGRAVPTNERNGETSMNHGISENRPLWKWQLEIPFEWSTENPEVGGIDDGSGDRWADAPPPSLLRRQLPPAAPTHCSTPLRCSVRTLGRAVNGPPTARARDRRSRSRTGHMVSLACDLKYGHGHGPVRGSDLWIK